MPSEMQWRRRKKGTPRQVGKAFPIGKGPSPYTHMPPVRYRDPYSKIKYAPPKHIRRMAPHKEGEEYEEELEDQTKNVEVEDVPYEVREAVEEQKPKIFVVPGKKQMPKPPEEDPQIVMVGQEEVPEVEEEEEIVVKQKPSIGETISGARNKVWEAIDKIKRTFARQEMEQ